MDDFLTNVVYGENSITRQTKLNVVEIRYSNRSKLWLLILIGFSLILTEQQTKIFG